MTDTLLDLHDAELDTCAELIRRTRRPLPPIQLRMSSSQSVYVFCPGVLSCVS